jgi:hypothetical protein
MVELVFGGVRCLMETIIAEEHHATTRLCQVGTEPR